MSQMYPSSSHQLVAAAFRRARKKFPTNFGQLDWPINYPRRDGSKSESFSSSTTMSVCKNCEERFSCYGEIHNSRSNNLWPSLGGKRSDPRGARSTRENAASLMQRNSNEPEVKTSAMASARSICPCRRNICKSRKKQNFAVSFGETNERSRDRRISGGDARDETISRKTCPDRVTNDCPAIENKMGRNFKYRDTASWKAKPEIPSNLSEWDNRTNSFELRDDRSKGNHRRSGQVSKNCECKNVISDQLREESAREENRRLKKTERCLRDSSISKDGKARSIESQSSSFGGTNRLCKDCSLIECSRNSSCLESSLTDEAAYERVHEREDRVFHDQDLCAIKHKDSLAILVEKFKNKKIRSSDDETTIYKSEEDSSENESTTNLINKEEKSQNFRDSSTEEKDKSDWIELRIPKSILGPRTFPRASKSRARSCGYCCSIKEI